MVRLLGKFKKTTYLDLILLTSFIIVQSSCGFGLLRPMGESKSGTENIVPIIGGANTIACADIVALSDLKISNV